MAIKDYEIIKQIGSGGMGAIYLARDPRLDRLVAIKKTRIPNNLEKDVYNEMVQRFYREARAIANLNHPNIVTIYDLGEDDHSNECFMVMEYLEGKAVDSIIDEQKTLSINLALKIGIQACEALSYLHQKQIIHRDIKPANIMYCSNGMVKLVDFGLVRIDDNLDLTRAGTLLGSVLYMSPEQIKNPKNIDAKVDIYAFGVTMYQALSGKFPYNGENVWDVIRQVTMEEPIPLSKANPDIPFAIEKAIMKAIAKNKEDRYADISLLQNDLANYNNSKVQTIISPLSYSKGTGRLPSIEEDSNVDKTVIQQNNFVTENQVQSSQDFMRTQMFDMHTTEPDIPQISSTIYKGAYKPDTYFNRFKPEKNEKEISEKTPEQPKITPQREEVIKETPKNSVSTDTLSNYFFTKEKEPVADYPSFDELMELNHDTKNKILKINESLIQDIASLKHVVEQLTNMTGELQSDANMLQSELKGMVSQYNVSVKHPSSNLDLKDLKRKIDYKKSQKNTKENDAYLLKDKLSVYSNLLKFKNLRLKMNKFIIDTFEHQHRKGFFNCENVFKITELQADKSKEIIMESVESIKNIERFYNESENIIEYSRKIINSLKIVKNTSIGRIIKYTPKSNSLEINLAEECDNNLLVEIDTTEADILFTYCQMTRNERPVPKFQAGDLVSMFSEDFDETLKDKIKSSTNIYKSKSRIYKKELIENELSYYLKIAEVIKPVKPIVVNHVENNFEQLIQIFSEVDTSEDINQEKRQSLMVKMNKIKKTVLELKKDLEAEDEEIKNYVRYINPILLAINKYPALIKTYEDEARNKKEYRKKAVHNLLAQINKGNFDVIREQKNYLLRSIESLKDNKVPDSIIKFLTFYMLSKAKLPTEISKNQIVDFLNKEKNLLSTIEIDWVCRLLNLNFSKEKGFILKIS